MSVCLTLYREDLQAGARLCVTVSLGSDPSSHQWLQGRILSEFFAERREYSKTSVNFPWNIRLPRAPTYLPRVLQALPGLPVTVSFGREHSSLTTMRLLNSIMEYPFLCNSVLSMHFQVISLPCLSAHNSLSRGNEHLQVIPRSTRTNPRPSFQPKSVSSFKSSESDRPVKLDCG